MARCAVCLLTLARGEKFALVDQYVVHRTCEGGPIANHDRVQRLEGDLERQRAKVRELQERLDDSNAAMRSATVEVRKAAGTIGQCHNDAVLRISEIADLRSALARKDAELQSERNLRALAELQARSGATPPVKKAEEQISTTENEPVDITAVRFGLLELD